MVHPVYKSVVSLAVLAINNNLEGFPVSNSNLTQIWEDPDQTGLEVMIEFRTGDDVITNPSKMLPEIIVPPQVVLQSQQTQVQINCSVQAADSISWTLTSFQSFNDSNQDVEEMIVTDRMSVNECLDSEAFYRDFNKTSEQEMIAMRDVVTLLLHLDPDPQCLETLMNITIRGDCSATNKNGNSSSSFMLRFSDDYLTNFQIKGI